jgi:hypothetical protein
MNKRWLLTGLAALPFFSGLASASTHNRNAAFWRVPAGVRKVRVRSWTPDGKKDMDRTLNVVPGELFRLDALKD